MMGQLSNISVGAGGSPKFPEFCLGWVWYCCRVSSFPLQLGAPFLVMETVRQKLFPEHVAWWQKSRVNATDPFVSSRFHTNLVEGAWLRVCLGI